MSRYDKNPDIYDLDKCMWGDPPKPNMWKVEHGVNAIVVTSPAMEGDVYFHKVLGRFKVTYRNFDATPKEFMEVFHYGELWKGIDSAKHFLSESFFKNVIKKKVEEGVIKLKVPKLASSLKVQWGAPPKPNLWKVEHSVDHDREHSTWMVTSPAMAGAVMLLQNKRASPNWWVNYYYDRKETHSRSTNYKNILNYFSHADGEMTDAECLEHFLSENFYRKVFKKYIKLGVIELKVPKVASTNLQAMWGDPPKPNLWKVGYNKMFAQYTIKSPVLEGSFVVKMFPPSSAELSFFDSKIKGKTFAKYLSPITIGEILSRQFYLEYIKPAIYLTQGIRLKGNVKVASSDIKLQWGDPPKPNLWKVTERPGRDVKHHGYIFDIRTPLDPELGITIHQSPSFGARKLYKTTLYHGSKVLLENAAGFIVSEGAHPADIFSTKYFWDRIKDEIRDNTPTPIKVASSNPKVMWGDPPKPNMWKVETLKRSKMVALTRVTSPVLQGSIWLGVYGAVFYCPHDKMTSPLTEEKMLEFENKNNMVGDLVGITKIMGINPKRLFLSNKFYLEHLAPKIADGSIKLNGNVKVASGESLKAMWGDPPKPNIWSVAEFRYGWSIVVRVFSPLMEGEVWLVDSNRVVYFPKGSGLPLKKTERPPSAFSHSTVKVALPNARDKDHFLSHEYWTDWLSPLGKKNRSSRTPTFRVEKVASKKRSKK